MRIDAHQHFWKFNPVDYPWIDGDLSEIRRDFLPEHLQSELARTGLDGAISVQARQSLEETRWLLELASQHAFVKAVVGWVDLLSADVGAQLQRFAVNPKFRGVRHVLQDEVDDDFMLRRDFFWGLRRLREFRLTYDLLIRERHLPQAMRLVEEHPEQVFILDHLAKPRLQGDSFASWQRRLRELARRPNVYCKVSGLVTEAAPAQRSASGLRRYLDAAVDAFGAQRLMFGSDWPVCLAACKYEWWHDLVCGWIAGFSSAEQERIQGGTAAEAYGL